MKNTLAYHGVELITVVKVFIKFGAEASTTTTHTSHFSWDKSFKTFFASMMFVRNKPQCSCLSSSADNDKILIAFGIAVKRSF